MITLFERNPEQLFPLTRIRPVWDLRVGAQTLRERVVRAFPEAALHVAGRADVVAAWRSRNDAPAPANAARGGHVLDAGLALTPIHRHVLSSVRDSARLLDGAEQFVGVWNAPDSVRAPETEDQIDALDTASRNWTTIPLPDAVCIRRPHDFIRHLDRLLIGDADWYEPTASPEIPGVRVLGDGAVHLHPSAHVDPGTTFDTREGPIVLDAGANVSFGTWLAGPALLGARTRLLGGTIGPFVGFGPECRIRGEVAESYFHGFSNKAHDGFIGHSVVGEWVNLGAMTSCSDLKNNYGNVRLSLPGGVVDTGLTKFGILAGDHVKAAIGSLFNTGTVIGTAANVFGEGGFSPKAIAPFAWGDAGAAGSYGVEQFLTTAQQVFARRDVRWDEATEQLLRNTHASVRSSRDGTSLDESRDD